MGPRQSLEKLRRWIASTSTMGKFLNHCYNGCFCYFYGRTDRYMQFVGTVRKPRSTWSFVTTFSKAKCTLLRLGWKPVLAPVTKQPFLFSTNLRGTKISDTLYHILFFEMPIPQNYAALTCRTTSVYIFPTETWWRLLGRKHGTWPLTKHTVG